MRLSTANSKKYSLSRNPLFNKAYVIKLSTESNERIFNVYEFKVFLMTLKVELRVSSRFFVS